MTHAGIKPPKRNFSSIHVGACCWHGHGNGRLPVVLEKVRVRNVDFFSVTIERLPEQESEIVPGHVYDEDFDVSRSQSPVLFQYEMFNKKDGMPVDQKGQWGVNMIIPLNDPDIDRIISVIESQAERDEEQNCSMKFADRMSNLLPIPPTTKFMADLANKCVQKRHSEFSSINETPEHELISPQYALALALFAIKHKAPFPPDALVSSCKVSVSPFKKSNCARWDFHKFAQDSYHIMLIKNILQEGSGDQRWDDLYFKLCKRAASPFARMQIPFERRYTIGFRYDMMSHEIDKLINSIASEVYQKFSQNGIENLFNQIPETVRRQMLDYRDDVNRLFEKLDSYRDM